MFTHNDRVQHTFCPSTWSTQLTDGKGFILWEVVLKRLRDKTVNSLSQEVTQSTDREQQGESRCVCGGGGGGEGAAGGRVTDGTSHSLIALSELRAV